VVVDRTVTRNQGPQYRNDWRRGERFDYRRARNYRVINDYRGRHLKAPPRGYHYVQSGNDAVLVGITSGVIAGIIAGALR
jgi:Ni/Co efflux regulator RcnB